MVGELRNFQIKLKNKISVVNIKHRGFFIMKAKIKQADRVNINNCSFQVHFLQTYFSVK